MKIESATDMLNWTDEEMAENMGLKVPVEEDGEPGPDVLLEPAIPEPVKPADQLTAKPQEGKPAKAAAPAAPAAEVVDEEEAEPEPTPERAKPIVEYKAFDKDGEIEIPEDVTFTYEANGKTRENVPADRLVRLAQMGEYNVEREQRVTQAQQVVQEKDQLIAQRDQQIAQYDAWFEQVLADPAFRQRALENYEEQHTPEARLARAEEALRERDTRERAQSEAQQDAAFVETHLTPRVTQLLEQNPSVPFEEVYGQFNILIAPYMVRGIVPRQHLPTVKQIIDTDLAHWVRQKAEQRELDKQRVTNREAAARTEVTLAKRRLVRATKPAAPAAPAPAKSTEFESAEDWFNKTLPVPATP